MPDHLSDASHVLIEDPDSLYPWLHLYLTVPPKVKTLPVLLPLEGVPGSPQSVTRQINDLSCNTQICSYYRQFKLLECEQFTIIGTVILNRCLSCHSVVL